MKAGHQLALFLAGAVLCLHALPAAAAPAGASAPRSRHVMDLGRVNETWARQWEIEQTAVNLPGGGRAGFYRRPARSGDATPYKGRRGILYLYPESRHVPVRLAMRNVSITPATSRLAMGVSANRSPRGEWNLKVFANDTRIGPVVTVSGDDEWQDLAYNLSRYEGRQVDIAIEAHDEGGRASHVYFDYIRLTDPARQPVSLLPGPSVEKQAPYGPLRDAPGDRTDDTALFDRYYRDFLDLMREREETRQYEQQIRRDPPARFRKCWK